MCTGWVHSIQRIPNIYLMVEKIKKKIFRFKSLLLAKNVDNETGRFFATINKQNYVPNEIKTRQVLNFCSNLIVLIIIYAKFTKRKVCTSQKKIYNVYVEHFYLFFFLLSFSIYLL